MANIAARLRSLRGCLRGRFEFLILAGALAAPLVQALPACPTRSAWADPDATTQTRIRDAARAPLERVALQFPFFPKAIGSFNAFSNEYTVDYGNGGSFAAKYHVRAVWPAQNADAIRKSAFFKNYPCNSQRAFWSKHGFDHKFMTPLGENSCLFARSEYGRISTTGRPGSRRHTVEARVLFNMAAPCFVISLDVRMKDHVPQDRSPDASPSDPCRQARRKLQQTASSHAMQIAKLLMAALDQVPEAARPPIILLPGVAGTSLFSRYPNSPRVEVWPLPRGMGMGSPLPIGHRNDMMLKLDGKTPTRPSTVIYTGPILRNRYAAPLNFYGGLIDFLSGRGYTEQYDLFTFPYDWRMDNAAHFDALETLINRVRVKTGKDKVVLLAHSMGGVVARAYLLNRGGSKVSALISMGTPYFGAPKPYFGLVNGYTFGNKTVRVELMKILLQNMPAAYQLFPRIPFVRDRDSGRWLTFEESCRIRYKGYTDVRTGMHAGWPPLTYVESRDNIWTFNGNLVALANRFHAAGGPAANPTPLPNGVDHYVIIGHGMQTLASYLIESSKPGSSYIQLHDGRKVIMTPQFTDGDGTVPLRMLKIRTATATYYAKDAAHGGLPADATVQSIVWTLIKRTPPNPSRYGYAQSGALKVTENIDFTLR